MMDHILNFFVGFGVLFILSALVSLINFVFSHLGEQIFVGAFLLCVVCVCCFAGKIFREIFK